MGPAREAFIFFNLDLSFSEKAGKSRANRIAIPERRAFGLDAA